ncbi:MAG: hypothetical protein QOI80_3737 [Solirubrobacteraceae bacterium]|nr:hypothetical protein [Solirubrobacteraceae bacterium]
MPLFAAALRRGPALPAGGEAFAAFAAALPFYPGRAAERWAAPDGRYVLHWITEEDDGTPRVGAGAAFFGRPIVWTDTTRADGRAPLAPGFFARPPAEWAAGLDGRCAVLRYADGALEVYTDPLGAYPLYRAEGGGALWIANSPVLAAQLAGLPERPSDPAALAAIVGGGWSLSGEPPIPGVRRVPPEWLWRFDADGERAAQPLLDLEALRAAAGRPLDTAAASATVRAALAAQADWPGRPSVVAVTGGRDSRVVLAAALAAGEPFTAGTGGGEDDPDVVIARQLCERTGVPHRLIGAVPGGDRWSDPARAAAILWALTGGTATLANGAGFPLAPWELPRALWHSGQGGEIGRRVYGDAADADALLRLFLARRPGRPDLLTPDAAGLVHDELARFVDETRAVGFAAADIPDVYYLRRRMGTWAGPTHAAVEPVRDITSVLWSRRVAPHLLAGTPADRLRERFHRELVGTLAPALTAFPFQDGSSWTERAHPRIDRARRLTGKLRREVARRLAVRRTPEAPAGPAPPDPRAALLAGTREALLDQPVWDVLERRDVDALLALPPDALDDWRWQQVWRLASLSLPAL